MTPAAPYEKSKFLGSGCPSAQQQGWNLEFERMHLDPKGGELCL